MVDITLTVNGNRHQLTVEENMPLLWVLRDLLNLKGTKYGCGQGICGACSVLWNGSAIRSCVMPASSVDGEEILTIEGLNELDYHDGNKHPVQQAWMEENVPQCGYCQAGQIINAVALLERHPAPNDQEINAAMSGNLCRCGTYPRIRKGIKRAAKIMAEK